MEALRQLSTAIYDDIINQNRKNYRNYAEQLTEILVHCKDQPQQGDLLAVTFYNLAKLSSRYRYVITALEFKQPGVERVKWTLQMLALASSRGNHQQAFTEACKLIDFILTLIQNLKLDKELEMFGRQLIELIHRSKNININTAKTLNELQLSRHFQTDCPYVSKTFHIADIMVMEPINFDNYKQIIVQDDPKKFFYYVVYLSIACFTRATQRFYCRQSTDRDFHFKAIQIAGYLYSSKSTYMRFLKRTYKQHYLQHLQEIQEVDEYGQLRVKVYEDTVQIGMHKMPWEEQQQND